MRGGTFGAGAGEGARAKGRALHHTAHAHPHIVQRPPVSHHEAFEAHPLAQVLHQAALAAPGAGAAADVGAVESIVATHDRRHARLDRRLEWRVVGLKQRAVRRVRRHRIAVCLLGVEYEVLGARGDTDGLDGAHVGGGERRAEVGVLPAQVLAVAPVARYAVHIHCRAEDDVGALFAELDADRPRPRADEGGVPGGGRGERAREGGHLPDVHVARRAEPLPRVLDIGARDAEARHARDVAHKVAGQVVVADPAKALEERELLRPGEIGAHQLHRRLRRRAAESPP